MARWSKPYRKVGVREKVLDALRRTGWIETPALDARLGHSCLEILNNMRAEGLVESRPVDGRAFEWRLAP